MKVPAQKRQPKSDHNLYCDRCCIRIAPGERHLLKEGKTYHFNCYLKVKDSYASQPDQVAG